MDNAPNKIWLQWHGDGHPDKPVEPEPTFEKGNEMSKAIAVVSEVKQTITDEGEGDLILIINGGGVGFNVGGRVIVKPVREWHRLAEAESFPSLLRPAVRVDARDATPEQLRRGANIHASLREPKT